MAVPSHGSKFCIGFLYEGKRQRDEQQTLPWAATAAGYKLCALLGGQSWLCAFLSSVCFVLPTFPLTPWSLLFWHSMESEKISPFTKENRNTRKAIK